MTDAPSAHDLGRQLIWLFVLALPIATIAWTITHEEIAREWREWCRREAHCPGPLARRKFFYVFTCEYCFSHWVALAFMAATRYRLLLDDWRGHVIGFFAVVAVANLYLTAYTHMRVDIKGDRAAAEREERELTGEAETLGQ